MESWRLSLCSQNRRRVSVCRHRGPCLGFVAGNRAGRARPDCRRRRLFIGSVKRWGRFQSHRRSSCSSRSSRSLSHGSGLSRVHAGLHRCGGGRLGDRHVGALRQDRRQQLGQSCCGLCSCDCLPQSRPACSGHRGCLACRALRTLRKHQPAHGRRLRPGSDNEISHNEACRQGVGHGA